MLHDCMDFAISNVGMSVRQAVLGCAARPSKVLVLAAAGYLCMPGAGPPDVAVHVLSATEPIGVTRQPGEQILTAHLAQQVTDTVGL
jgi:hypothetical protein